MIRTPNPAWLLALVLVSPQLLAAEPAPTGTENATAAVPAATPANVQAPVDPVPVDIAPKVAGPSAAVMPTMDFVSSVLSDDVYTAIKATPAFATIDKELAGSPLTLMVTHSVRPTAGGQAAGFLSALLSGSTLGILPIVTNERLVVKYEVRLNGRAITSATFERTDTRAQSIWGGAADTDGLGKDGANWVKGTAAEAATKIASDPAMLAVIKEIDYYFPSSTTPAAGTVAAGQAN